ncbi:MAG: cytochrome c family protein [Gammaproteobacteria bacterium]|nr:cytochrome c family protein [Gammaproteobacteria bacterium]
MSSSTRPARQGTALLIAVALSAGSTAAAPKAEKGKVDPARPFPPSYITIEGHKNVKPEDWKDPRLCGQCHTVQYEGWNGSMHSNAFRDPVFQALWALGEKADPNLRNHCGACHTAIGTATQTVEFVPTTPLHGGFKAPEVAEQGVGCDVCHTISGTNFNKTAVLEHGNSSYVVAPGPTKRAGLADAKSPYHDTAKSDHHTKSDFCGNCHNIFHPTNDFPVERTYDEWKYSVYAQNGIQCQDCHMVPVEVANKVADTMTRPEHMTDSPLEGFAALGGPLRKVVHTHGFIGGNAVIVKALGKDKVESPEDLGRDKNYGEAVKRLKSAASLHTFVAKKGDPLHELTVKVTNERAGHHLPTSLTEVRQIWLEVVVTDDQGREVFRNGTLDASNEVPKDAVVFNAHAADKNGQYTQLPWEIARFTDVNTIPPKGYKYARYYFNVPADAKSLKVSTKLHYRSFAQQLADLLLGKGAVQVPSIEMATLEESVELSELQTASAGAAADKH